MAINKGLVIEYIPGEYSVYKAEKLDGAETKRGISFVSVTDKELSVMCESKYVPPVALSVEHGFKGMRIAGTLDFSLIGILADISRLLAEENISIFVTSTFDTDYIFTKTEKFEAALEKLRENGYETENSEK